MNLIGISGKKSAGKNTVSNYLHGLVLASLGTEEQPFVSYVKYNDKGQIIVPASVDNQVVDGILDLSTDLVQDFFHETQIDQIIKQYSFADPLKKFCINILGLPWESCYGTEAQKNEPTQLKWEDMPGVITELNVKNLRLTNSKDINLVIKKANECNCFFHTSGNMSGRDVLQWFGTDICRKIYGKCWTQNTINLVKKESPELGIILDVRFINEIEAIQEAGGKIIRLTRSITDKDQHLSETELDNYNGFDYILDNKDMSIEQQNKAIHQLIVNDWKMLKIDIN